MDSSSEQDTSICAFDYLPGTLATAYKGLIQSLVISDFCIDIINDNIEIRGRVIDLPESVYHIRLISEGKALSETKTRDGTFSIIVNKKDFELFKHLQLDLLQKGRHIGTFLLKTPEKAGPFTSALELSEEVRGLNLRGLVRLVENRLGLKRKAEHLISASLSPKKNWKDLSVELYSFSRDLFWADREAFHEWLLFILRFLILSIHNLPDQIKPVNDLISILSLIAEKSDPTIAEKIIKILEENIKKYPVDLTSRFKSFMKTLLKLNRTSKTVQIEIPIFLIDSLIERLKDAPYLSEEILMLLNNSSSLLPYSETSLKETMKSANLIKKAILSRDILKAEELLDQLDLSPLDSPAMVRAIFRVVRDVENKKGPFLKRVVKEVESVISENNTALEALAEEIAVLIESHLKNQRFNQAIDALQAFHVFKTYLKKDLLFRQNLIEAVFNSGHRDIENTYLQMVSRVFILPSGFKGYNEETWEPIFKKEHLERLKDFITVLAKGGYRNEGFLTSVITNLYMIDLFIPDEALFQRHITQYLNAVPLGNQFILHYLLLKRLPVYYNEVGATGRLRELSTELDALGNDPALYFLRKQVHVNSGPHNIHLVEVILQAWTKSDIKEMTGLVPEEIRANYPARLLEEYSKAANRLFKSLGIRTVQDIISLKDSDIARAVSTLNTSVEVREKLRLLILLYKELNRKYGIIKQETFTNIKELIDDMMILKNRFSAPEKTIPDESLYFKRHIAFGIPSVMGTYREEKFDALKEFLKKEEILRSSLEMLAESVSEKFRKDIKALLADMELFLKTLQCLGFRMSVLYETIDVLKHNTLHLSQVVDMVRKLQRELVFLVETFYRWFLQPSKRLLSEMSPEDLSNPLKASLKDIKDTENLIDILIRQIITAVPGLQEYDRFLNNIMQGLLELGEQDKDPLILKGTISLKPYYMLDKLTEDEAVRLGPYLGGKAKNLALLISKGIDVPPGVVLNAGYTFQEEGLEKIIKDAIAMIEEKTGRGFGATDKPLFLSVRSGSYLSMPGILDSILYCGMNLETLKAFIAETGDEELGWDSYRRFLEHYMGVVHGLRLPEVTAEKVVDICHEYLDFAKTTGISIPDDPFEQLMDCIKGVYRSWFSEKALSYRKAMSISDRWGTAVLIMPMLWANSKNDGASVFYTRDPKTFSPIPFGDTQQASTGDDIVYGKHLSMPISRVQEPEKPTLEETEPALYKLHYDIARRVEEAMGGIPQEIEAVYLRHNTHWRLFVLQTRAMEFYRSPVDRFHDICRMESNILTRGIGVHGGAMSGIVTFENDIRRLKDLQEKTDMPLILIRKEASTADAEYMPYVDGLLTSTGGVTSHASVLAKKFDITAVVGCSDLEIDAQAKNARIGDFSIEEGTMISIDGATGTVYKGICQIKTKASLGEQ